MPSQWLEPLKGIRPTDSKPYEMGQRPEWSGTTWVKNRGWITPDIDLTGVVSAASAIESALSSRPGACVQLPDGYINIDRPVALPDGASLVGSPQAMREGALVWSPPKGGTTGSMILATDPSHRKLFTFGFNAQAIGLGIHYPNQSGAYDPRTGVTTADAAPVDYDYTFYVDSKFGCAVENCYVTNPYRMMWINNTQGAHVDHVRGWPLFRGIVTGRIYDVLRISRVHFNQNALASNLSSPTLTASVLANGVGMVIDGCDDFKIHNCYMGNYQFGIWLHDGDADDWLSYGDITDTGIECVTCVVAEAVSFHGVRIKGASWAPNATGHGLKVQDDFTPASAFYRPNIELYGVRIGGGTQYYRGIWVTNTSHAVVTMWGGGMVNFEQYGFVADGADAIIKYNDVKVPASLLGGASVDNGGTGVSGTTIAV